MYLNPVLTTIEQNTNVMLYLEYAYYYYYYIYNME